MYIPNFILLEINGSALLYLQFSSHGNKNQGLYPLFIFFRRMDEGRQPLWRKLSIPSSKINPYRMIILLRIVILGLFFQYRITHPVNDAYGLWLTSVICEIWFAVTWILDQFPKWSPIVRETYLDRLSLRYPVCLFSMSVCLYDSLFLWNML